MRRWTGGLRSAGVVGIGVVVLSGCPSPSDVSDDELTEGSDPWTSNVTYTDPDGRFAVDFPAEPQLSSKPDGPDLDIYSLTAEVDDGWEFTLAWSDAPRGTALARSQEMRPETAEENAAR